ncbi:mechanosensitive ion channel family protein [Ferrimonas marina]|uniref:Small-conductance mechanosensitive channel n=1 Tax=Ferrimonas marina TaxID=299255 RepID=A0A1M5MIB9_9GAMM|nr:mechanosensitive ion channel family protein [Ferrimonas marina]SHG76872.1 small conductance mechanosensitive channel [Ferrimonas marina]
MKWQCALIGVVLSMAAWAEPETEPPEPSQESLEQQQAFSEEVREQVESLRATLSEVERDVAGWERQWQGTESEFNRQFLQQQILQSSSRLSRQMDQFIRKAVEDRRLAYTDGAVNLLLEETRYLDGRLKSARTAVVDVYSRYEKAFYEEGSTQWVSINDMFTYLNWLLQEKVRNVNYLRELNVAVAETEEQLAEELTTYADYLALALKASSHQIDVLEQEMKQVPEGVLGELQAGLQSHQRMERISLDSLRELVRLMENLDINTSEYNELIFKNTGDLVEVFSSWDAMKAVARGLMQDFETWREVNMGSLLSRMLLFAMAVAVAWLVSRLVQHMVSRAVSHEKSKLSNLVQDFLVGITGRTVLIIGILWALSLVGLDPTPIFAGLGVAGIVIGFALQDTLSNFASGMMILIYRPFDVGDFVEAGGVAGKVGKMSLVNTTIRTFDNQVFVVPNTKIWTDTIKNITAERVRRVDMEFGIAYEDDVPRAEALLAEIVEAHEMTLATPEPTIKLHRLGESSVDFIVRPWVRTEDYWDVYWDITREVKIRFDQEGLTIPYPQRQLHLSDNVDVSALPPPNSADTRPADPGVER